MNIKVRIQNEAVMAYLKVLSQNSHGEGNENHDKPVRKAHSPPEI
jgi:hypothetical protein